MASNHHLSRCLGSRCSRLEIHKHSYGRIQTAIHRASFFERHFHAKSMIQHCYTDPLHHRFSVGIQGKSTSLFGRPDGLGGFEESCANRRDIERCLLATTTNAILILSSIFRDFVMSLLRR